MTFCTLPDKMESPCVLVASCSETNPSFLIEQILGVEHLPEGVEVIENILSYDWQIDTKYYTADVCLCTTEDKTIGNQSFAESVEAFVVHFNTKKVSSFDSVEQWLPYLKELEPEIQMLVCDRCLDEDVIGRVMVQEWCIVNGFELVELSPEEDNETEDDFEEATGINRIVEALRAHRWPNLVMKDNPNICSPYFRKLMQEEAEALNHNNSTDHVEANDVKAHEDIYVNESSVERCDDVSRSSDNLKLKNLCESSNIEHSLSATDKGATALDEEKKPEATTAKSNEERVDSLFQDDDIKLFEAVGKEDPGSESFEQLFERLKTMKDKAEILPLDQRKSYAEKVVVSFWKAMGGDEDEIADLDDSESEET